MVDTARRETVRVRRGEGERLIWLDGALTEPAQAMVPLYDAAFIGQTTVFEGIRGYWNAEQRRLHVFRPDGHLERFAESMKIMRMQPRHTPEQIQRAILEVVNANQPQEDSYIRPIAWLEPGNHPDSRPGHFVPQPAHIAVNVRPNPSRLLNGALQHVCVSSWTRIPDNIMPARLKAQSNYHNSRLATVEAQIDGYDGAILLNQQGKVAEGPLACLFIMRRGVAVTPPVTAGILESITRFTVMQLLTEELGIKVVEREVDRTELYVASEAFYCGTGFEITPIASVDRYTLGNGSLGPITARVERLYHDLVRGIDPRHPEWRMGGEPVAPITL